jgi:hypothetical protein
MSVERSDMPPRVAAWTLGSVVGLVALTGAAVAGLLAMSGGLREATPAALAARATPMLQADEREDRAAIEARAAKRLRGAGGGVQIDEAMRRTAEAGWDARP